MVIDPQVIRIVEMTVTWILALSAIAAAVSGIYIVRVYRQRHEEALFLTRLVQRDVRVALASAFIMVYLALAVSGFGLGRPWGAIAIGIPIIVMMLGPVSDALLWRKERKASK